MKQRETDTGDEREREKKKNLEEAKFRFLVQLFSQILVHESKKIVQQKSLLQKSFTSSHTQNSY